MPLLRRKIHDYTETGKDIARYTKYKRRPFFIQWDKIKLIRTTATYAPKKVKKEFLRNNTKRSFELNP